VESKFSCPHFLDCKHCDKVESPSGIKRNKRKKERTLLEAQKAGLKSTKPL
jgi:hypothetical protein